ncbi:MAG: hypothetical protein ABR502_08920 [Chitinophagaceae bacterium]
MINEITFLQNFVFATLQRYYPANTTLVMKMAYLSAVITLSAIVQNCSKQNSSTIPNCIQQRINQIKSQHKWNPPAEVHEYIYNNKKVYLFSSDCCDQFNTLVDAQCNYICAPSGGITGKGDMKCTDFSEKAQHVKLVWKDER